MPIIGTAGHVDHGKSTLVHALTGIDPDRLAEEKRRGMTIDLGFAHVDLPGGVRAGVVDVPGHARFLPNMLAGVHGMDAVLLVVAADEGIKPQTREHLDILDLLDVRRVVVALTKMDLVDDARAGAAAAEVSIELERRGLAAEVIPVVAPDGTGLDALRERLADLVGDAPRSAGGPARLPIDRAFTMSGFGVVVTGTLVDGTLRVGEEMELVPPAPRRKGGDAAPRARVRGLQQHGRAVDAAEPGSRVAVNLQGVDRDDVRRGQVLAPPGTLTATSRADVTLRVLAAASSAVAHNDTVAVYAGTAEATGRVVVLEGESIAAGERGWAQLRLLAPLALREGDAVVLRRPSPPETIAGGRVVDISPPPHRRHQAGVIAALARRQDGVGRLLEEVRRAPHGARSGDLAVRLALTPAEADAALARLVEAGQAIVVDRAVYAPERLDELARLAVDAVDAFQQANPRRPGMPRAALRTELRVDNRALPALVDHMVARGALVASGTGAVSLPGWTPTVSPREQAAADRVLARLAVAPLAPPRIAELAAEGLTPELRQYLEDQGTVVRVAPDLLMLPAAVAGAEERLRRFLESEGEVTVAQARDALGSTRRTVVPLLEYFDAIRLTRRDGDLRRLR